LVQRLFHTTETINLRLAHPWHSASITQRDFRSMYNEMEPPIPCQQRPSSKSLHCTLHCGSGFKARLWWGSSSTTKDSRASKSLRLSDCRVICEFQLPWGTSGPSHPIFEYKFIWKHSWLRHANVCNHASGGTSHGSCHFEYLTERGSHSHLVSCCHSQMHVGTHHCVGLVVRSTPGLSLKSTNNITPEMPIVTALAAPGTCMYHVMDTLSM
jgi:hypothetical protein